MTLVPIRVIKLGGSLLRPLTDGLSDVNFSAVDQLPEWLSGQAGMRNILIVGGGQRVDKIRSMQIEQRWNDAQAHWLSIQQMDIQTRLVHRRLAKLGQTAEIADSLPQFVNGPFGLILFNVEQFLRHADVSSDTPLPHDWTVTSDSIAAHVAAASNAEELVLLKSTLPNRKASIATLAQTGFIDLHFPQVVCTPIVRFVQATRRKWEEVRLDVSPPAMSAVSIRGSCPRESDRQR